MVSLKRNMAVGVSVWTIFIIFVYTLLTSTAFQFKIADIAIGLMTLSITPFIATSIIFIVFFSKSQKDTQKLLAVKSLALAKQEALLEEQKRLLAKEKEKTTHLKNQRNALFINPVHELRTSLTLILGPLARLKKELVLEPAAKESLERILANGNQMKDLTNQLLDSVKIENAVLQVNKEGFELNSLLVNILESFQPLASHRNINYQKDIQINNGYFVKTDKNRLKIILKNILVNAFKFTDAKGSILFKAWEKEQVLYFEIKDTGSGINPEYLPYLFDLFYQVPSTNQTVSQGSGLGLYIVKEYLEIMGGKIEVKSDVGFGTSFLLKIPFEKSVALAPTSAPKKEESLHSNNSATLGLKQVDTKKQSFNKKQHILIVEDSLDLNNYIKSLLQENFSIHQVYDGQQALDYLEEVKQRPDLIICDVMMPKVSGLVLLKQLRHTPTYASIPIIMLTAKEALSNKIEALTQGANDYLTKPFEEEELLARVNNLLKNSQPRGLFKQNQTLIIHPPLSKVGEIISQEEQAWLQNLEEVCQANISKLNLTIDDIAEEMAISRAQFFRRVKKLTGLNPGEYLQEARLQEALKLIRVKKYSTVKAVAYSVGFKSDKYFSKKFKTRFGVYPSKYHQENRKLLMNKSA